MDPYKILGLDKSSTINDINKAYRECAKKYHPDVNRDNPEAANTFKEIQKSYEILSDTKKRQSYDSGGMNFRSRAAHNSGFEFSMDEIFSNSVFRGKNLQEKIEIDLVDVLNGCEKEITFKKSNRCKTCSGNGFSEFLKCEQCNGNGFVQVSEAPFVLRQSCGYCSGLGKINTIKCDTCKGKGSESFEEKTVKCKIPPGIEHMAQIVFSGEGDESLRGGRNGDLLVFIFIRESPIFKREGPNVFIEIPVSYSQLALGGDIITPCVSNEKVFIKVPAGCQAHTKFRVKGKGMPARGSIGDMIVTLKLETPREINEEYKAALLKLSELEKQNVTPNIKNWNETIH